MWKKFLISSLIVILAHSLAGPVLAIDRPGALERLNDGSEILSEFIDIPEESIPSKLLKSCEALVIIPHVVKAALIIGGRRGHGVMIHRLPDGTWSSPSFVTLTGGSIGLQLGGQAFDLVLVVNNQRGYEALMEDNFKFGVNASAAAGPVGRNMEAGTDIKLKAEIYAYARSKGLFAGIALDGAALTIDHEANTAFYGRAVDYKAVLNDPAWHFPPEAKPLIDKIEGYIGEQ